MQRTDNTDKAKIVRRHVGSSTTLNRKYVRRPGGRMDMMVTSSAVMRSPRIQRFNNPSVSNDAKVAEKNRSVTRIGIAESQPTIAPASQEQPEVVAQMPVDYSRMISAPQNVQSEQARQVATSAQIHPMQEKANMRMRKSKSDAVKKERMSAKEMKEQAIKKALAEAAAPAKEKTKKKKTNGAKIHFGFGRVILALSCAAVAVFAVVYFVNLNMPDVSLKVAAMQTGINASYPTYVPRDYTISSITSEDKKIVLEFKNSETESAFTLVEETSSWDSNALLNNFVKDTYDENYQIVKEQGLTIYISGSNASWVNGGIVYKITTTKGSLTNKQIKAIATSL